MSVTADDVSRRPVFVVGCPRSGTTLLYHMLLSSGSFAILRAESHAFNVLAPRFGDLARPARRKRLLAEWLTAKPFQLSGLNGVEFSERVLHEARNAGDFLRIFMEAIAANQGARRWADCTPAHLLHMPAIKRQIPGALFIHVIRDGRDVAVSYADRGWLKSLPGDRGSPLLVAGMHWRWMVRKGRNDALTLSSSYMEVRFEQLVREPAVVLESIGDFIDHPLDYERIRSEGIGSVAEPNTSFGTENKADFSPIGRWRRGLDTGQAAELEFLLKGRLRELGYPLEAATPSLRAAARLLTKRALYRAYFDAKHWARMNTPLGRLTNVDALRNW